MLLFIIALATFCATMVGGLVALRLRDKLHLILGFSAGAVMGVAFFELLPEAMELGLKHHAAATLALYVAGGFLAYLLLDRAMPFHGAATALGNPAIPALRASLGAASLSVHSFLDGVAIGLAFNISSSIGAIVTMAVLMHDFSDGMNTMNMVLKNGGNRRTALRWLTVDAIAPALGILSTFLFIIPEPQFGLLLSVFAGLFLYIGASDLIPESYHSHPKALTTIMTLLGMATIYIATLVAG
jgi:zinc transporter ZupT